MEDLKKLFRQERGRCGEIRNATLEEAAELADGCDKRATPRGIACAIRAIKSTPAPTAVEGANDVALPPCPQALVKVEGMPRYLWPEMQAYARAAVLADRQRRSGDAPREDDMLTIAYLAGAQAEKERAALSAQPGAIRNPLIAEPSGNPGELDCAALSARKEGTPCLCHPGRTRRAGCRLSWTMVELKVLGSVLNNHRYMLRAIKTDATIPQAVKDAEAASTSAPARSCATACRVQVAAPQRSVPAPPQPIEDGGADV